MPFVFCIISATMHNNDLLFFFAVINCMDSPTRGETRKTKTYVNVRVHEPALVADMRLPSSGCMMITHDLGPSEIRVCVLVGIWIIGVWKAQAIYGVTRMQCMHAHCVLPKRCGCFCLFLAPSPSARLKSVRSVSSCTPTLARRTKINATNQGRTGNNSRQKIPGQTAKTKRKIVCLKIS